MKNVQSNVSQMFIWKISLSSSSCVASSRFLYRSGLWRQKTFARLSPEVVTAWDASLRDRRTQTVGLGSNIRPKRGQLFILWRGRTCWWRSRGFRRCGRGTRTPCCQSERPIGAGLRLNCRWTPQKKTPPSAGERCRPGGAEEEFKVTGARPNQTHKDTPPPLPAAGYLVLAPVPQDLGGDVVNGQSPVQVRHRDEREAGHNRRHETHCPTLLSTVRHFTILNNSHVTESHRFHGCFLVYRSFWVSSSRREYSNNLHTHTTIIVS